MKQPMNKKENLVEHHFTHEDSVKGGQSRSILKSIVKRRTCSKNCKLFNSCPFATMGLKYETCYLNCGEYPTLKRNINKLLNGEQKEFFDVVSNVVCDMLRIAETEDDSNIRTKKTVVDALEKLHNMKYGSKEHIEHSAKDDKPILIEMIYIKDKKDIKKLDKII